MAGYAVKSAVTPIADATGMIMPLNRTASNNVLSGVDPLGSNAILSLILSTGLWCRARFCPRSRVDLANTARIITSDLPQRHRER